MQTQCELFVNDQTGQRLAQGLTRGYVLYLKPICLMLCGRRTRLAPACFYIDYSLRSIRSSLVKRTYPVQAKHSNREESEKKAKKVTKTTGIIKSCLLMIFERMRTK